MNRQPARPIAKPPSQQVGAPSVPSEGSQVPQVKFPDPIFTGSPEPSIIPSSIENLIFVTGFRGMGKTYFGLGADHPSNILMLDFESKGKGVAAPYSVGGYFPIMDEVVGLYGEDPDIQVVYDRVIQILKAVPEGRFTTLFLDNAVYLQDGAIRLVQSNPAKAVRYGLNPENVLSGGYGGARPAAKYLLANLFKLARSRGIRLIVVSFQLTGAWADKKPLFNKFKTTDVTIWHEMSILTLVLVEPMAETLAKYGEPVPRALVMKEQLGEMKWDPELKRPRIHRRIPYALPMAEMWRVYEYLEKPADLRNPKPGETVDVMEISPFLPTFSKEQLIMVERLARAAKTIQGDKEDEPNGHSPSGDDK